MKSKHTPFGMDEGTHKMCEELFANRYFKSAKPETIDKFGNSDISKAVEYIHEKRKEANEKQS